MTDREHKEMEEAMERQRKWLMDPKNKKEAIKYLKEIGFWQLTVPIKSRKARRPSRKK